MADTALLDNQSESTSAYDRFVQAEEARLLAKKKPAQTASEPQQPPRKPRLAAEVPVTAFPTQYNPRYDPEAWTDEDERLAASATGNLARQQEPNFFSTIARLPGAIHKSLKEASTEANDTLLKAALPNATLEDKVSAMNVLAGIHTPGFALTRTGAAAGADAGSFFGAVSAKNLLDTTQEFTPASMLSRAEAMSAQGMSDAAIMKQLNSELASDIMMLRGTNIPLRKVFGGISKNAAGQWRMEVSNAFDDFHPDFVKAFDNVSTGDVVRKVPLEQIIESPVLFKLSPELRNLPVTIGKQERGYNGGFYNDSISVNATDIGEVRRVLNHEIQHYFQMTDRMPRGAGIQRYFGVNHLTPSTYKKSTYEATNAAWMQESIIGKLLHGDVDGAKALIDQLPDHIKPHAARIAVGNARAMFNGKRLSDFNKPDNIFDGHSLEELSTFLQEYAKRERYAVMNNTSGGSYYGRMNKAERKKAADEVVRLDLNLLGSRIDESIYLSHAGEAEARMVEQSTQLQGDALRALPPETRGQRIPAMIPVVDTNQIITYNPGIQRASPPVPVNPEVAAFARSRGFVVPQRAVTVGPALDILKELNLKVTRIKDTRGTTYIYFNDPKGPALPGISQPKIRIPNFRDMHRGHVAEGEQGVLFDVTWPKQDPVYAGTARMQGENGRNIASHMTDEQGRPYAEYDVLRETLMRRYRPEMIKRPTDIPGSKPPDDPNQYRLFE